MLREKFKYQMFQPKNSTLTDAENKEYQIIYEETQWTLDRGEIPWHVMDDPLIIHSDNINEAIRKLNIENINFISEDYKNVSSKILTALSANAISATKLMNKRDWCYYKWTEFETLFDEHGWDIDVEIPEIFRFQPTNNYMTIVFGDKIIHLTETQGQVIKILHTNYLKGNYTLTSGEIFAQLNQLGHMTNAKKISEIFDGKVTERDILIKSVGRGIYSLNMPPI